MIDKELERYYESRFSMMCTEGWKDLIEDVENMIAATDRVSTVVDEKQLWFKKGELSILAWIKMLKDNSEEAYKQLKEEDESNS